MSKKLGIVSIIISVVSLVLAVTLLIIVIPKLTTTETKSEDIQYVLYLGTNDKDTNTPVFAPDEAKYEAEKILIKHFGGYTIQDANGGWIDGETEYQEYTLVIYLSDTTLDKVHLAANDLIAKFNQSSVLIQANKTSTEFYSGK